MDLWNSIMACPLFSTIASWVPMTTACLSVPDFSSVVTFEPMEFEAFDSCGSGFDESF